MSRSCIRLLVLTVAIMAAAIVAPAAASATDRYVDPQIGVDVGDCSSLVTPCQSIPYAITNSLAGDRFVLDDGTYLIAMSLGDGRSIVYDDFVPGDSGGAIVDGGGGTAITVAASGAGEISGLTIRGDIRGVFATGPVEIVSNTFDDPDSNNAIGVEINTAGNGSLVRDNIFLDPNPGPTRGRLGVYMPTFVLADIVDNYFQAFNVAIQVTGGSEPPPLVEGNTIVQTHNLPVAGRGMIAGGFGTSRIRENTISDPADSSVVGISASTGAMLERNNITGHQHGVFINIDATGVSLDGDRIWGNTQRGIWAFDTGSSAPATSFSATNVTVFGNPADIEISASEMTLDSSIVGTTTSNAAANCTITYSRANAIGAAANGCDAFQTADDPGFVDAANGDFHLLASSPLLDLGNPAAPAEGAVDFDGDSRAIDATPTCDPPDDRRDIGADEFVPTFEPDCVAPNTSLTKKPKKKISNKKGKAKVTFKLASTEPGGTFECKLDKKPWKPCPATYKANVKKGKHTLRARAIDPSGNVDPTPVKYAFKIVKKKKR